MLWADGILLHWTLKTATECNSSGGGSHRPWYPACAFIYCLVFQWGSSQQMYQIPIWISEYIHRYLNRTALFARKFSDIFDISITIIVEAVILDCQKKHVHWAPLWHHGSFHWGIGHRRQMISAFIDVLVIPLLNYCTRFLPTVPILCIHLVQLHNSELI